MRDLIIAKCLSSRNVRLEKLLTCFEDFCPLEGFTLHHPNLKFSTDPDIAVALTS